MVGRNVLIAVDGKKQADKALVWYLDNMNREGDHVILFHCSQFELHVGLPGMAVNVENVTKQVERAKEQSDAIMKKASEVLRSRGVHCEVVVKANNKPHEAILAEVAERKDVDHIVMGTRDLGSLKRAFVGSVSTEVVRHASVGVSIVK